MTISNTTTRIQYVGDGGTTAFPTTFPFFEAGDLAVRKRNTTTNVVNLLSETVDYTVAGGAGATGTVTMLVAPTSDEELTIERVTELTQESDYASTASIQESTLESDLDRAVVRDQEIRRDLDRSLHYPQDDDAALSAELPNAETRAGKFVKFDASGNVAVTDEVELSPSAISVGAPGQTLLPLSTFAAWRTTLDVLQRFGGVDRVGAAALSARPSAASFGVGIYFATDTHQLFYSTSLAWFELGAVQRYPAASLPASAAIRDGAVYLDTDRYYLHRDDGSTVARIRAPLPRGWIAGLNVNPIGNNIIIGRGSCRVGVSGDPDQDDAYLDAATLTKSSFSDWAAGDGLGGRASGVTLAVNTPYHVFLLLNPTTGAVEAGLDTSPVAANLLTDTTPSGFTKFRRIRTVWTEAGFTTLEPEIQHGDVVVPVESDEIALDVAAQNYTAGVLVALRKVPPDVRCQVVLNVGFVQGTMGAGEVGLIRSGGATIVGTPNDEGTPLANFRGNSQVLGQLTLLTNTARQVLVKMAADTSVSLRIDVDHYIDARGRWD